MGEEHIYWGIYQKVETALLQCVNKGNDFSDFMQNIDHNAKDFIYKELGVIGGAYLLKNKLNKQWTYLHNAKLQEDLVENGKTPFIEIPFLRVYGDKPNKQKLDSSKYDSEDIEFIPSKNQRFIDALFIGTHYNNDGLNAKSTDATPLNSGKVKYEEQLILKFEKKLRDKGLKITYCVSGEVSFYIYAWLILFLTVRDSGLNETTQFKKDVQEEFLYKHNFWELIEKNISTFNSRETSWWKSRSSRFNPDDYAKIEAQWDSLKTHIDKESESIKNEKISLYSHYFLLGLCDKDGVSTRALLQLVQYMIHIARNVLKWEMYAKESKRLKYKFNLDGEIPNKSEILTYLHILERRLIVHFSGDSGYVDIHKEGKQILVDELKEEFLLDYCFQKIIREYLFDKVYETEEDSIPTQKALTHLHQQSRFPILPYYYHLVSDDIHQPREHFTLPIWSTYGGSNKKDDKTSEPDAYLYLMLKPIWNLPGKKYSFLKHNRSIHWAKSLSRQSYNRLYRIKALFHRIALPVINNVYYDIMTKDFIEQNKSKSDVTAFSHEMNKIVDNLIYKSNVGFIDYFKEYSNRVADSIINTVNKHSFLKREDIIKWRIITSHQRMESWAGQLMMWSGRRGYLILDYFKENDNLDALILGCNNLALQMYAGERLQRQPNYSNFRVKDPYGQNFNKQIELLLTKKSMIVLEKNISKTHNLKPIYFIKKSNISNSILQNALIRLLSASITNIYEHASGKFYLMLKEISYSKGKAIEFLFINQFENPEKKSEFKESYGTKPVLNSCLQLVEGDLKKFGVIPKNQIPKIKREFNYNFKELKPDLSIWATQFIVPIRHILEKIENDENKTKP